MHFLTYVILPKDQFNLDQELLYLEEKILNWIEPLRQCECGQYNDEYERTCGHRCLFDWGQLGGRWTGHLTDYDPKKDENNLEKEGKIKWPTQWKKYGNDIQSVSFLRRIIKEKGAAMTPYYLICPSLLVYEQKWNWQKRKFEETSEEWEKIIDEILNKYDNNSYFIAILDLHN